MTNNTINNITAITALKNAAAYADINIDSITELDCQYDGNGLYELNFNCNWVSYEAYVDAETGEVLGFMTTPMELIANNGYAPVQTFRSFRAAA